MLRDWPVCQGFWLLFCKGLICGWEGFGDGLWYDISLISGSEERGESRRKDTRFKEKLLVYSSNNAARMRIRFVSHQLWNYSFSRAFA